MALKVLFQTEFETPISYQDLMELMEDKIDAETLAYTKTLIEGVQNQKSKLDSMIKSKSAHWSLDRMSLVDRNLLRLACFEMKVMSEPLAPQIVINEAIEIARKYGTTDSASFVNGLLDALAKDSSLK